MDESNEHTKLLNNGKVAPLSKEESHEEEYPSVPFIKLYKYSSVLDKLLLVLAVIITILGSGMFSYFAINIGSVIMVIITFIQTNSSHSTDEEMLRAVEEFDVGIQEYIITNVILAVIMMACTYCATLIFNYTALRQTYRIRNLFLYKVLNQDISWHDVNQTGDFASRMADDIKRIEDAIGEKVSILLYYLSVAVICVIQALILGWELALICMLSVPITAMTMLSVVYISSKLAMKETNAYGAAGALADEVLTALRTVVAFGGEKSEGQRYYKLLKNACENNIKRGFINGIGEGMAVLVIYCNYALGFWYGVRLIVRDREVPADEAVYDAQTMVSVFFSVFAATMHLNMSTILMEPFGVGKGVAARIFQVIDSEFVINRSKGKGLRLKEVNGKITFKNVHFEYPSRPDIKILRGLDLVIHPGETVALVGSSGCGKSTCVQLIQRFYDPRAGNIYIDDHRLQDFDLTWIRSQVGVVGQEPVLFEGTIEDNIRMGCTNASWEDIEKAAIKANAHAFIKVLPRGYGTLVGERGTQLSGGQKQRIAIARALVRKPSILLLDEATSALDIKSEAIVQAALDSASAECTTVIVAHRLSTVRKADRIVVISEGQIEEQGTHAELIAKNGVYYALVMAQVTEHKTTDEDDTLPPLIPMEHVLEVNRKDSADSDISKKSSYLPSYFKEIIHDQTSTTTSIWKMLQYNAPELWAIIIGCIGSLLAGCCLPIFATIYGGVLGVLSNEDGEEMLTDVKSYSIGFTIMGIIAFWPTFLQVYFLGVAGEKLTMRLRSKMFEKFMSLEMGYFDYETNGVGALCSTLAVEAASVQGATGYRIGVIVSSFSTIVLGLAVCFYYEWRIAFIALCFSPIIIIIGSLEKKMVAKEDKALQNALQASTKIAVEAISGIRTVAGLGCEQDFHKLYMTDIIPYQNKALCNTHIRAIVYSISRSIMFFSYSAVFAYGAKLIKEEGLDYSIIFTVAMAVIIGSWSLAKSFAYTPNLQKGLSASGRIIQILNQTPLIRDGSNSRDEKWDQANIEYDNVHFSYPTRRQTKVLKGFDLSVLEGKTVALVGPSGCGKSTVVQLLERFYDPTSGTVSVDGKLISTMHLSALRSHLGIVSQEPNLFSRTIAENISYGDNSRIVSQDEIIEAAKAANIHDFIVSLSLGYETKLGEKGTQLSGGQKQRIAIARAILRNPRILLLDEATSALDAESEKVVQEALDKARLGRTCITIAHRLSTIQDADVICVINRGRIAEIGTHQELLALKGIYYDLNRLQL